MGCTRTIVVTATFNKSFQLTTMSTYLSLAQKSTYLSLAQKSTLPAKELKAHPPVGCSLRYQIL